MALLLGGFAFNANAQGTKEVKKGESKAKTTTMDKKIAKSENMDKTIKDFEETVDKCVTLYQAINNPTKGAKNSTKAFDNALAKAEKLQAKLEKAKDQLNRGQVDRFQKAADKLKQVYIK